MEWWMWVVLALSIGIVVVAIYTSNKPETQEKVKQMAMKKKKKTEITSFDESELKHLQQTAEDFLEFDTIEKGMISFTKDPNYFTMAFRVQGVNISMLTAQERVILKNGFMSILNTLKEDIQILVQSRYVDLNKNFEYYKPVIEANRNQVEHLYERVKIEESIPLKEKLLDKARKLEQCNNYANHIIDFFNFYTRESECIYIQVFVVVGYRYKGSKKWNKNKIAEEAYDALSNKVKILREQFETIGLKTYELDSIQTANIIYSTLLKNESSYAKLEDAIENGLLDVAVEVKPGEFVDDEKYNKYRDDYEYPYYEAAATKEE